MSTAATYSALEAVSQRTELLRRYPVSSAQLPIALRLVELSVATLALVLLAPVMVVIAIVIRRGTPGPAIFRQQRIGIDCKPFTFLKFVTITQTQKSAFRSGVLMHSKRMNGRMSASRRRMIRA